MSLVQFANENILPTNHRARPPPILAHPGFASGDVSTGFLAEEAETLTAAGNDMSDLLMAVAALSDERLVAEVMQIPELHRNMGEWRN